jgi:hypothetical protein
MLRKSSWKFDTSWSGGVSAGFFAATTGTLYFKDPTGFDVEFSYLAGGVGWGVGVKGIKQSGSASSTDLHSEGTLYMLPSFNGKELSREDISGVCEFIDVSAAYVVGKAATVMRLGGDAKLLPFSLLPPASEGHQAYLNSFKAMVTMSCHIAGAGGGVYAYGGYLSVSELSSEGTWKIQANGSTFYYRFLSENQVEWAEDKTFSWIRGKGHYIMQSDFMRINWIESGDTEEWNLPLDPAGQTGFWYPKPKGDGLFPRYSINAEKING